MSEHKNTLAEMFTGKKEFLRLVILATLLSFSVGVLASLVAASTVVPTAAIYVVAILITATVLLLLAADIRQKLAFEDKLTGVLFIDPEKNELVKVRDYELANDLSTTMAAVKVESRAIYSEWENDPLVAKKENDDSKSLRSDESPEKESHEEVSYTSIVRIEVEDDHLTKQKASYLLDEALQFVLLDILSTHLSSYFTNSSSEQITELSRDDIPAFLLKNRVLNLLTMPIEQRDVFLKAYPIQKKKPDGIICSLWGSDGSMYSRFDLTLPKDSKVNFLDRGALHIETKRLNLEISGRYKGSSAAVSPTFAKYYVGRSWENLAYRNVEVILKGRVKPLALFSNRGWEDYYWLDSFRTKLKKSIDFVSFLREIHWDAVESMSHTLQGQFNAIHKHLEYLSRKNQIIRPISLEGEKSEQAGEIKK